ncbi:hypothetical protein P775_04875 [Puniceibacterium antarcticum]|uniref:Glucans biosynthesis glucosyltransferase H n=2 Tax=Puniceibacterium antarcticum TaxID=1206336 RepID=A0A2G8RID6_9RHOB|nr:hypothetical protein P775_04875 [Puniceibacterium antarcticum]
MPTQDLRKAPARQRIWQTPQVYLARITAFGGAAALTIYGFMQMNLVFGNETSTTLQSLLLGFFTVTFGWIALSSTQALAAVFSGRREVANESSDRPLTSRTAIIMPVYNEDPATTCAALQAIGEAIADRGEGSAFEIFLLSDTTDPAVWAQETACFSRLRQGLKGKMQVWYRRRFDNVGRKAGNLREFVEQWGARYDHMLVLDADSLMAADTVITLARRMEAAPRLGILQSVPVLMGGTTVFARIQQFAGRVYGPIIARGVSAWQGLDGNYWGHNAIIRVKAFAECCGMPELPGRKPFGGHVMSHDFVEAALIRRGGWQVRMDTDLGGSWEGAPQSLLDLAARDRRWAQGNLQHVKVVGARGLSASNRAHFLIGIGSYLMSSIWLAMLVTGGFLTAQSLLYERDYFGDEPQLFPQWPIFDAQRMMWLLALSMALLFLPKILGALRAISLPKLRRSWGGAGRILGGTILEILLSALLAPILMLFQVQQVFEILSGRDSGWSAQSRGANDMSWSKAFASHGVQVFIGLAASVTVVLFAPNQIIWLAPVLAGLVLSPALSRFTGRVMDIGLIRLLYIPEDRNPPPVALRAEALRADFDIVADVTPMMLLSDPKLNARHLSSLPPVTDQSADDNKMDLDVITTRAKLSAAGNVDQAIGWLTKKELTKLLSTPELLSWGCEKFSRAP